MEITQLDKKGKTQYKECDFISAKQTKRAGARHETYQEELGELSVAELLVPLGAKVQPYKLRVPVEGDVLVDGGLAKNLLHILYRGDNK